jgi:hypothetical protein
MCSSEKTNLDLSRRFRQGFLGLSRNLGLIISFGIMIYESEV